MYTSAAPDQLVRRLGFWSSIGIGIGVTIGSGIFRTPEPSQRECPTRRSCSRCGCSAGSSRCAARCRRRARRPAAYGRTGRTCVRAGAPGGFLFGWVEHVLMRLGHRGHRTVFTEYLLRSLGDEPAANALLHRLRGRRGHRVAAGRSTSAAFELGAAVAGVSTIEVRGARLPRVAAFGGGHGGARAFHRGRRPCRRGTLRPRPHLGALGVQRLRRPVLRRRRSQGSATCPAPRDRRRHDCDRHHLHAANVAYLYVNPVERVAQSPLVPPTPCRRSSAGPASRSSRSSSRSPRSAHSSR